MYHVLGSVQISECRILLSIVQDDKDWLIRKSGLLVLVVHLFVHLQFYLLANKSRDCLWNSLSSNTFCNAVIIWHYVSYFILVYYNIHTGILKIGRRLLYYRQ